MLASLGSRGWAASLIQPNQTIVFMGDSITFRGNYTRQLSEFLQTRYPSYNLRFINTGMGGWTAQNAYQDSAGVGYVVSLHPDIVTLCLGMNDAGYVAYDSARFNTYTSYMTQVVTQLRAAGIQVVLMTPGIVDLSAPASSQIIAIDPSYNSVLGTYANWVMSYASSQGIPAYDLHALMTSTDSNAKAALPGFCMIPDGIHPDMAGGLLYAYGLMKALGVPSSVRQITLNSAGPSVSGGAGLSVGSAQGVAGGWSFDFTCDPMPYVPGPAMKKVLPYMPFQQDLNAINFSASGLTATAYYLLIDGYRQGPVSATALAAGVNLVDYWTEQPQSNAEIHTVQLVDAVTYGSSPCYAGTHQQLVDDMEKSNIHYDPTPYATPYASNLWGGKYDTYEGLTYTPTGPTWTGTYALPIEFLTSSPGHNSGMAARITGTVVTGSYSPGLYATVNTRNLYTGIGVAFWFKASAGCNVRFQARTLFEASQSPPYYNDHGFALTGSGSWAYVTIPYTSLTVPYGTNYAFDPQDIINVNWLITSLGNYDLSIDDLQFYCSGPSPAPPTPGLASPTPTFTPSPTPTPATSSQAFVNRLDQLQAVPNPNPSAVSVRAGGHVDGLRVRVYSKSFHLVYEAALAQSVASGWTSVPLPAAWQQGLANDIYYLAMDVQSGGTWLASPGYQKIYLLR